MYRLLHNSNIPKWLKILLYIVLTLSLVYLVGLIFYKVLEAIRWLLHNATEKRIWWITLIIALIATIIVLVILEINTDIDPFTNAINFLVSKWKQFVNWCASLIGGGEI